MESNSDTQKPGIIETGIILVTVCMSVMVTAVLGPSLPKMEAHFASLENISQLVPFSMTAPMLVLALFSVIAGYITDRLGRKWLLVAAALAYGVIGSLPMFLEDMYAILGSRFALGFAEAFVVVIGAALIGDLFEGTKRDRMFAMQATTASIAAFFLNNIGGVLGDIGWRWPYAIYSSGILLAVMAAIFIREPNRKDKPSVEVAEKQNEIKIQAFPVALISIAAIYASLVFVIVPLNLGYLFNGIGVDSSARIGMAYGLNSLGVIGGSILFGWWLNTRTTTGVQLAVGFLLMSVGFFTIWFASSFVVLTIAGVICGLGSGILLPSLIVGSIRLWPGRLRGRGLGLFMSCQYFGNFLAGLAVVWLVSLAGTRIEAMKLVAMSLIIGAVLTLIAAYFNRSSRSKLVAQ